MGLAAWPPWGDAAGRWSSRWPRCWPGPGRIAVAWAGPAARPHAAP